MTKDEKMKSIRPHNRTYRKTYRDRYGPGPYVCAICCEEMVKLEVVHHIDEDVWNGEIENLEAHHTTCHNRHHHVGLKHSDGAKERIKLSGITAWQQPEDAARRRAIISESNKKTWTGRKHTPEAKAKISATRKKKIASGEIIPRKGVTVSEETRAKISAALRRKNVS